MTVAEARDILDAVVQIARAHGFTCHPTIQRRALCIELKRGFRRRVIELTEQELNACGTAPVVRELIERSVTAACRDREASS